jgi:hypothetical protein
MSKLITHTNNIAIRFGIQPIDNGLTNAAADEVYTLDALTDATTGFEGDDADGVENSNMNLFMKDVANNMATIVDKIRVITAHRPLAVPPLVVVYD